MMPILDVTDTRDDTAKPASCSHILTLQSEDTFSRQMRVENGKFIYLSVQKYDEQLWLILCASLLEDRQATMTSHMFSLKETDSLREILIIQDHLPTYQL